MSNDDPFHPVKLVFVAMASAVLAVTVSPWFLVLTVITLAIWAYRFVTWVME